MIRDQRCGKRSDGSTKTCGTQPGLEGLRARRRGRGRGVPAPPARVAPLHRPGCCRQRVFRLQTSKAKAAQVGMIIFFRLRPNGNENSSLGQELDFFFFSPTPDPRNDLKTCSKCSEPMLQSFGQLERVALTFLGMRSRNNPASISQLFRASLKRNSCGESGRVSLWERGLGQGGRSAESARLPV